jgi:hypothetical protein
MPSMQATSWVLVCCLLVAGFGFLVTRSGSSSSSSMAESSPASTSQAASAGNAEAQPETGTAAGGGSQHDATEPSASSSASAPVGFSYFTSGIAYQRSTLVSQVRQQLANLGTDFSNGPPTAPAPASSAPASAAASSSPDAGFLPSPQLTGCVDAVTNGASPSLVDKATYDGIPAYIIAVPTEVWVVRRGCTAADTELIVRVPLKG